jgi:hypothetical protein
VRISGGDIAQSMWVGGRSAYFGECAAFLTNSEPMPAAVIRLDEPIVLEGYSARIAILRLRYARDRWSRHEFGHVELCASMPADDGAHERQERLWVESRASCTVVSP